MRDDSEVYVGLDTSKLKISVALATAGRDGEVRFLGDIDSAPEAVERLVRKLEKRHRRLCFAYEAGPTGHRLRAPAAQRGPRRGAAREAGLRLRGRPDRLRAAAADHDARARLRRGRALADPEASGRAGQDQPP